MKKIIIILIYIYIFLTTVRNFSDTCYLKNEAFNDIINTSEKYCNELKDLKNVSDLLFAKIIANQLVKNLENNAFDQDIVLSVSDMRQKINNLDSNFCLEVKKILNFRANGRRLNEI